MLSGQTIRGYRFQKEIGAGSHGQVYQAYQPHLDRTVAIKVILPEMLHDASFANRFLNEVQIIAKLEHPHIVPLHDYWQDEQGMFLVMRLFSQSLRGYLRSEGAIEVNVAANLLDQLASALDIAHRAGIIHRDIKPDNILLDGQFSAYLGDFGVAKNLHVDSQTSVGAIIGTPAYASPEQIQGEEITLQSDIYSLGILLYEMLIGEHPFGSKDLFTIAYKHIHEPLPRLENQQDTVNDVIHKATAKRPEERYSSAGELARALRAALAAPPAAAISVAAQHYDVFISYRRQSSSVVAHLIETELEMRGISVFLDVSDMSEAGAFPDHLKKAIRSASYFVCLLADKTLDSKWVLEEIQYALEVNMPMIPVFQEGYKAQAQQSESVRVLLNSQGIQLFDERGLYIQQALDTLIRMIKPEAEPQHQTPAPVSVLSPNLKSRELRNRAAMLENVRTYWIDGVLEHSLYNALKLELGMTPSESAVIDSWDKVLQLNQKREKIEPGTDVIDIYDRLNGKLLILGDPGGGKTTTLLELTKYLLDRADVDVNHPIPVVFNLSSWSENPKPIEEWLVDELNSKYQAPRKVAQQWVDDDDILLLLDGLDEVAGSRRDACVAMINAYREAHGFVDIVVCSRTQDYGVLANRLRLNGAVILQQLTDIQVDMYLERFGKHTRYVQELLQRDKKLREMSRSPLMLSILALTYQDVSGSDLQQFDTVEGQRQHVFHTYVERMMQRGQSRQGYSTEAIRHYLALLAKRMQAHAQSIFFIDNLQPSWLHTDNEHGKFRVGLTLWLMLSHGALYAAAGMLSQLIASTENWWTGALLGIAGLVWGWVLAGNLWRWYIGPVVTAFVFALCTQTIVGSAQGSLEPTLTRLGNTSLTLPAVIIIFLAGFHLFRETNVQPNRITNYDHTRFSWSARKYWVVVAGVIIGIGQLVIYWQYTTDFASSLWVIVMSLVPAIALFVFLSGLTSDIVDRTTFPNEGTWRSLKNGTRIGIILIPMFFLMNGVVQIPFVPFPGGIASEIGSAIMLSFHGFIGWGGYAAIQHFALRRELTRSGYVPYNYSRFLDYATDLILMRKVGGGYIFIHRYLLEYFAEMKDVEVAR